MGDGRLGLPDPRPEGLLAQARKIAKLSRRAEDPVHGNFLIELTNEQYLYAIEAFDSRHRRREGNETRAELEEFQRASGFILHAAPLLTERSAFRTTLDSLAASKQVGKFFNGTDDVDEVVALARRRMENLDRLAAADDAARAATCMLWRAHREEETIDLYNEYTDALMKDINSNISRGTLFLVETRARIARRRLRLTGRQDEASQLLATVYEALKPRQASEPSP
jgi:hypothetical protein